MCKKKKKNTIKNGLQKKKKFQFINQTENYIPMSTAGLENRTRCAKYCSVLDNYYFCVYTPTRPVYL